MPIRRATKPLAGRTIVVTRPRGSSAGFAAMLRRRGARVILLPTIEITPPRGWGAVDREIARLSDYDAVLFTSRNAVLAFLPRLAGKGASLDGIAVGAVGPATRAALVDGGVKVAWMAEEFTTGGLGRSVARRLPKGSRVLHPVADRRSPDLGRVLRAAGIRLADVVVYRVRRPRRPSFAGLDQADLVTFASAQTARNLMEMLPAALRVKLRRVPAACIGPVTARAARRLGFKVAAMPRDYTIPALVEEICRHG